MKEKTAVLGAGHWGMALAAVLAENNDVMVWARNDSEVNRINTLHQSKYFGEYNFPANIVATSDLEKCVSEHEYIVVALPTKGIDDLLPIFEKYSDRKYCLACKGMIAKQTITSYIESKVPGIKLAVLSGPSFSTELIANKMTAVVIASGDEEVARRFQLFFHASFFRPYTSTDVNGVQVCGAAKNVYAIAAGLVDTVFSSANMKSALLTRALAELSKLISVVGGESETLLGLAGMGDLMLTCHSLQSRNYRFGLNYYKEKNPNETTEGIPATAELHEMALEHGLDMPIIEAIYHVLYDGRDLTDEVVILMGRELKKENA